MEWPSELELLTFGHNFDKPLTGVRWPPRLRRLEVGAKFNHPVSDVRWPRGLREIVFGDMFDQASKTNRIYPVGAGNARFWRFSLHSDSGRGCEMPVGG